MSTWLGRFRCARTFENYFIKSIEHFFGVYIASSKHSGSGGILDSYANNCLTNWLKVVFDPWFAFDQPLSSSSTWTIEDAITMRDGSFPNFWLIDLSRTSLTQCIKAACLLFRLKISILGSNKVCKNINTVLISEVRFSSTAILCKSLFVSFFNRRCSLSKIWEYFSAALVQQALFIQQQTVHVQPAKCKTNSQDNHPYMSNEIG